jgi:hypothetical protein
VLVADSERTAIYTNFKAFIQSIVMVPAPRCQRYLSLVAMCVALLQSASPPAATLRCNHPIIWSS